ncbi:hypothetical protein TELCIR_13575 [Teladorsagia circumcincta]|uniref:Serine carboxypeptidase S28 n=1 Tax=Teladorsagia circumcincta TaxID=45464 RepID=A0A2G9U505_TELCI|nr:hypothetical protein TELCIR_13575 [Teladorsagia circumcincta]
MVMTHGSLDPWHALRNDTCDSSNNCFLIQGTAHCADMYPAREQDPQALVDTRKNIEKILEKWLAPPAPTDAPAEKWTGFPNNIVWSSPPVPVEVNTEDASHSINYDSSRKKATTSNSAGTMAFTELVILFITMALFIRQALVH